MNIPTDARILRIYLGEADRLNGRPLFEGIVLKARELGIAGATVLHSPLGFGQTSQLRTAKILNLSTDLPMVIEVVDSEEKLKPLVAFIDTVLVGGLVIMQPVTVLHHSTKDVV